MAMRWQVKAIDAAVRPPYTRLQSAPARFAASIIGTTRRDADATSDEEVAAGVNLVEVVAGAADADLVLHGQAVVHERRPAATVRLAQHRDLVGGEVGGRGAQGELPDQGVVPQVEIDVRARLAARRLRSGKGQEDHAVGHDFLADDVGPQGCGGGMSCSAPRSMRLADLAVEVQKLRTVDRVLLHGSGDAAEDRLHRDLELLAGVGVGNAGCRDHLVGDMTWRDIQ